MSRVEKKNSGIDCPARTIHEEDLQAAVVTAINDAWSRKDIVLPVLKANIESVLGDGLDERLSEVDEALKEKQEELLKAAETRAGLTLSAMRSLRSGRNGRKS